ncbi:efflux RND transporter periplasmic adaptor subunit [Teredinibacter purpureus]|uniref:efflux RND transporter periplasmic adaptor subunit n=1 Tax=Teredinibacter purpureus TaxID=2731756 RepID=UPI000695EEE9|nr:efflux RND transporter periplasmic adaptor subunit [Teredinibacter purpureus]
MKLWPRKISAGWVIAPVGLILFAVLVSAKPKPQPNAEPVLTLPEVTVVEAEMGYHKVSVTTQGVVSAGRQIDLVAELSGTINFASDQFVAGGFIGVGEPVLAIDDADYRYAITSAQAKVAEASNLWAKEKGLARRARQEWKDLGSDDANNLFLRVPQVDAAEAMYKSSVASLDQARLNLKRTNIASPFFGRVKETYVDLGQYVNSGSVLAKIYDTSFVEVRLPLTDQQAALLNLPLTRREEAIAKPSVTISADIAGIPTSWEGKIVRVEASVDEASRVYFAVARVNNLAVVQSDSLPLMVGLFVNAEIEGRTFSDMVELPREAIFHRNKIYALADDDEISLKEIDLLVSGDASVWVRGPIVTGERVVIEKQGMLDVGDKVKPLLGTPLPAITVVDATATTADTAEGVGI